MRVLLSLTFIFLYLRVLLFLVNWVGVFLPLVYLCSRLEDRINIQQNEVSEDGILRNLDQLSEVHMGKHHIGLIIFWKIFNTNLFYLDNMLMQIIPYQSHQSFKKHNRHRALDSAFISLDCLATWAVKLLGQLFYWMALPKLSQYAKDIK